MGYPIACSLSQIMIDTIEVTVNTYGKIAWSLDNAWIHYWHLDPGPGVGCGKPLSWR